jgi:hypothetical protein
MSYAGRKNGVLLCTVGPEFQPDRPWQTPPIVRGATLYAEGLALCEALGFTHVYNLRQLAEGLADGTWCVPIRRGHLYTSPDAPPLRADGNGHACPALAISREMVKAAIAAMLTPSPAGGNGRAESRVEGRESDVQSPLPFPSASSAPSAVDPPGLPDFGLISQEIEGNQPSAFSTQQSAFTPSPATRHPSPAAADVDELAMVLDPNLEVTPAALLVEGFS